MLASFQWSTCLCVCLYSLPGLSFLLNFKSQSLFYYIIIIYKNLRRNYWQVYALIFGRHHLRDYRGPSVYILVFDISTWYWRTVLATFIIVLLFLERSILLCKSLKYWDYRCAAHTQYLASLVLCCGNCFSSFAIGAPVEIKIFFLFLFFQDERALPKGDFFPPERPQQLPREYMNYTK